MAKKRKLKNNLKIPFVLIIIILIILVFFVMLGVLKVDKNNNGANIKYKSVDNFKVINKDLECTDKIISIGKIKEVNNIKLAYSCNSEQIVFYKEDVIITNLFMENFVSFYNVGKYLIIKHTTEDVKEYNYDIYDENLDKVNALELDDNVLNEVYDV